MIKALSNIKNVGYLLAAAAIISTSIFYMVEKRKQDRLKQQLEIEINNRKASEYGVQKYRDDLNRSHASTLALYQSLSEVKSQNEELYELIKQTNANLRRVEGAVSVESTNTTIIKREIQIPTMPDTTLTLIDEWSTVNIDLSPSKVGIDLVVRDKLIGVFDTKKETVKPPKKFFLCRWFQKKHTVVKLEVMNTNPNVEIENVEFIKIVK